MIEISISWLIFLGILANLPIGLVAYRKEALSIPGGFIAAAIIGYLLFLTHPILWLMLALFFGSSTILTKFKENQETKLTAMKYAEKGGKRDAFQVFANGGVAFLAVLYIIYKYGLYFTDVNNGWFLVVCISFAAANADTWATEIGTTSNKEPVWILNLRKRVPRGTSGGVSLIGTFGSIFGASILALFYVFFSALFSQEISSLQFKNGFIIFVFGSLGSLVDTLLGATLQATFICPECNKITEKRKHLHEDSITTNHNGGLKLLTNDWVNFLSIFIVSFSVLLL